jgi:hypothetical protein
MTASRDEATVRAILDLLRPVVDEIVLGVDAREADRILGTCGDLADRAYVYEFEGTVERYIAWLHHRCSGDWILRLDDDELPSAALMEALPELAGDRRHSLLLTPVRQLFPTRDQFIVSHPWHPDYRPRLVRNVPGLWTFTGKVHSVPIALGERSRIPESPIYHLHFADPESRDSRIAMAAERERLAPALMTECYPVNALSVPELWSGVQTAAVPDEDAVLIERIAVPARPKPIPARPAERIPPHEAARMLAKRTLSTDAYRAEIDISPARRHLAAGTVAHIEAHVRNLGDEYWPPAHQSEPPIRLTYRWLAADGETVVDPEGLRTPFEETVLPGERTVAMLAVEVPDEPGRYVLEVDIVHELVRWFECAARMEVAVEALNAPPTTAGHGLARPHIARIGL